MPWMPWASAVRIASPGSTRDWSRRPTGSLGFMQAEDIPSADFLATSHGGAVALMLAARHPERVRTLVLHAPANPFSTLADPAVHFYQSRLGRWFAHRIPYSIQKRAVPCPGSHLGDAQGLEGSLETYMTSLCVPGTIDYLLNLLEQLVGRHARSRVGARTRSRHPYFVALGRFRPGHEPGVGPASAAVFSPTPSWWCCPGSATWPTKSVHASLPKRSIPSFPGSAPALQPDSKGDPPCR